MTLELLVPEQRSIALHELTALIDAFPPPASPFAGEIVEFCAELSQAIFHHREAAAYPELTALAYWMRRSELVRLREQFVSLGGAEKVLSPRGVVFHLPPGNVDTIFVYSWLMAILTGNRNVLRLSRHRAPAADLLVRLLRERAQQAPEAVRGSTLVVSYGHEVEITSAVSSRCDVRVIWGGDDTVSLIRQVPLPPHARELTFPDRASLSVVRAEAYVALDAEGRRGLARQFFNDAYWFDQMACSSPRLVVWRGSPEETEAASALFWTELASHARERSYDPGAAARMEKLVFACRQIIDRDAAAYRREGETSVLRLRAMAESPTQHCGAGMFLEARLDSLHELVPALRRRDQTLTHFGFSAAELRELALELRGRAIDRMVPIGQALQFHRLWDGCDLLAEFCRSVHIVA